MIKIFIDNVWTPFKPEDIHFLFSFMDYIVVENINEADIIFKSNFNQPIFTNKLKIQIIGEPEHTNELYYDLTLGNKFDSDRTIYCPYFLFNLYSKQNNPIRINRLLNRNNLNEKKKFCLFINSNPTKERVEFVSLLKQYKHVDCLGKALNNGPLLPYHFTSSEFLEVISEYKFMICFENSNFPGYGSEKPINAYSGGAIPIYWGSKEIIELINPNAFVLLKENYLDTLNEIIYLDQNPEAYEKKWKEPFFCNNKIPDLMKLENLQMKIYNHIKKKIV